MPQALSAINGDALGFCRKEEASVKGLHNLARRLLTTPENGSEEDGQNLSKHGISGNARSTFQRDMTDDSGLSPVASFLLHRYVFPLPSFCEHLL